jgi:hypothetical protein
MTKLGETETQREARISRMKIRQHPFDGINATTRLPASADPS